MEVKTLSCATNLENTQTEYLIQSFPFRKDAGVQVDFRKSSREQDSCMQEQTCKIMNQKLLSSYQWKLIDLVCSSEQDNWLNSVL